ncbi:MAG: hypothetical protein HQL64_11120 [Magnetococcales bacterium]|nr:hypothetical protein [Magnetococcales bacterium]
MSITCKDLLRLAQRLAGSHLEVDLRDAGSRAYFAAFHACHQLSATLGLLAPQVREQEGHHKRLIRAMQSARVPGQDQADYPVRRLGQALRSLRDQRNTAEYRLGKSFVRSQAKQMIIACEYILGEAENILWERRERDTTTPLVTSPPRADESHPQPVVPSQTLVDEETPPHPEQTTQNPEAPPPILEATGESDLRQNDGQNSPEGTMNPGHDAAPSPDTSSEPNTDKVIATTPEQ